MRKILKKIFSIFLITAMLLASMVYPSFALGSYNANAALDYAKQHWNDGVGLCAEFVSKCLKAGGCSVSSNGATTLVRLLQKANCGTLSKLSVENDGRISVSKNNGKLSLGDPVFFYCPYEKDGCPYVHVVLYSGTDSNGYMKCYAHNNAKNNEVIKYAYCGYCKHKISSAYVFQMNGTFSENNQEGNNSNNNPSSSDVVVKTGEYYTIQNLASGKMLNVYGSQNASDTNVTVYEMDRTSGQDFQFISKGSGQYILQPRCATSCALNIYGYSATAGANVNIWTKSGNPTQSWIVEYNSSLDGYIIRSSDNPSYVLTADGSSNSSNVSIRAYNSSNRNQVWRSGAFSFNGNSNNQTANKPTISVTPSNLTLDLANQKTQPITVTIGGNIPNDSQLAFAIGNTNVLGAQWKDWVDNRSARAYLTGLTTGNSTISFSIIDRTTRKEYVSTSINVSVINSNPPITVTVNPSIVSLDLAKQTSQTVSLTISGNVQGQLVGTVGDSNVAQYGWGEYGGGNVVRVIITGKNAGGTIVRFALRDQNTGEVLASAYVHVAVTSSTYTVNYNANGGTNAPSPQTKAHQQAVTLSNSQPTREGYTFLGWSTSANGPVRYRSGAQYTENQSVTLYAVWQQNPTKVSVAFYRIELDEETLNVGESTSIHVIAVYSDDSTKDVTATCSLSLSDPSVATINRGRITAVKAGTTEISIKSAPDGMGIHATPTFTVVASPQVEENPIVGIEIRSDTSNISVGESTSVEVYAVHEDGIEDIITSEASINIWLSGIVELNGSTVTGLAEGSVVVFAEWNGYSSSTEIYVNSTEESYEIRSAIDNSISDWYDSAYWREETSRLVYRDDNT